MPTAYGAMVRDIHSPLKLRPSGLLKETDAGQLKVNSPSYGQPAPVRQVVPDEYLGLVSHTNWRELCFEV